MTKKNEFIRKIALPLVLCTTSVYVPLAAILEDSDPLAGIIREKVSGPPRASASINVVEVKKRGLASNRQSDKLESIIRKISADTNSIGRDNREETVILAVEEANPESSFLWGDYLKSSLSSRAAVVVNGRSRQVLYQKNSHVRTSLASISKLMSGMVFLDAKQDLSGPIMITDEDVDRLKHSHSRLSVGSVLTREELLHIGLMSSENRAIHALARTYPGGESAFVSAMNSKARQLGMYDTTFYEPTGLDPRNQSTASDIVKMAQAADKYALIRRFTTDKETQILANGKWLTYRNTNSLVRDGMWKVGLQKTGYIKEAGRCMVVKSKFGEDDVFLVFLGAPSAYSRVSDAEQVKQAFGGRYY
ncbi:MAG: serine hydrolase [Neisseriaceae bacterium]